MNPQSKALYWTELSFINAHINTVAPNLNITSTIIDSQSVARGIAIDHINHYGSQHTDAIITADIAAADQFVQQVDTANAFVNCSTRFSDGGQFGLGAEIGISTTKLHAYGPMGLKELTTRKFIVYGDGQVRI